MHPCNSENPFSTRIEYRVALRRWISPTGLPVSFRDLEVASDVWGGEEKLFGDDSPDDEEYEGYTGNEGCPLQ